MQTNKCLDVGKFFFCASYIANAKREGLNHLFPLRLIYKSIVYMCVIMSYIFHM